jgi:hypothetical protein
MIVTRTHGGDPDFGPPLFYFGPRERNGTPLFADREKPTRHTHHGRRSFPDHPTPAKNPPLA